MKDENFTRRMENTEFCEMKITSSLLILIGNSPSTTKER